MIVWFKIRWEPYTDNHIVLIRLSVIWITSSCFLICLSVGVFSDHLSHHTRSRYSIYSFYICYFVNNTIIDTCTYFRLEFIHAFWQESWIHIVIVSECSQMLLWKVWTWLARTGKEASRTPRFSRLSLVIGLEFLGFKKNYSSLQLTLAIANWYQELTGYNWVPMDFVIKLPLYTQSHTSTYRYSTRYLEFHFQHYSSVEYEFFSVVTCVHFF